MEKSKVKEMSKYVPHQKETRIRASKDGNIVFSQKIANEIKTRFCRLRYTFDENNVILLFIFTDEYGLDTLKVNRHARQVRISAPKLIKQLKLEGKETTKYTWIDNVLVVLFKR